MNRNKTELKITAMENRSKAVYRRKDISQFYTGVIYFTDYNVFNV